MSSPCNRAADDRPTVIRHPTAIERQIRHVEERLIEDYVGRVNAAEVRHCVGLARGETDDVRIEELIPVLIDRQARRRLEQLLRGRGHGMRPRVSAPKS